LKRLAAALVWMVAVVSLAGPAGAQPVEREWVIETIHEAADTYGISRWSMVELARCESTFEPEAVGYRGWYVGLFQWEIGSWLETPFADYSRTNAWANSHATGRALARGEAWRWPHCRWEAGL